MTVDPLPTSSASVAALRAALPTTAGVVAVCAHPDDESFGLGAFIPTLTDAGGITGHPDHQRATDAALAAAAGGGFPVLAWALPDTVAEALNTAFGTAFVGRSDDDIDVVLPADRRRQFDAIHRHASQSTDNPVLWRRLALQGDIERLRWLKDEGRTRQVAPLPVDERPAL